MRIDVRTIGEIGLECVGFVGCIFIKSIQQETNRATYPYIPTS